MQTTKCECRAPALWSIDIAIPSGRGVAYRRVRACTRCADKLAGELLQAGDVERVEVQRYDPKPREAQS